MGIKNRERLITGLAIMMMSALMTAVWSTPAAFGQTSRGTVAGTVTDSTEAVIAGARIELVNRKTGVRRSTETNHVGIYRFDAVDLGIYDLKISKDGFKQFQTTEIGVEANRTI